MREWICNSCNDTEYITVPDWNRHGAIMAFSSRRGGKSQGPYSSLNLGLHVGDDPDLVIQNRSRYVKIFDRELGDIIACEQVHGNRVAVVNHKHRGLGAYCNSTAVQGCDALITATPGVILATFYADCIPIYFFDPVNRVVAIAHGGWKGTMSGIAGQTLKEMQKHFGCNPQDVQVFIGPGIEKCCFEIGSDLARKVNKQFASFGDIVYDDENRYYWDLKSSNQKLLEDIGVRPENILCCQLCTSCQEELFFSYRRDNGITGRMGALIGLQY